MKDQFTEDTPSFQKAVSHQFKFILNCQDFSPTQQQIALLKFVVNQTLAGKGSEISDYTVAAEIFDRGPDFDHRIDPIVSIQVGILRWKLERYYETSGKNDPIRIDIPNDTYTPVFQKRKLKEP